VRLDAAREALVQALGLYAGVGDPQGQADALEDLAGVAIDQGRHDEGAQLLAAGQGMRDRIGYVRSVHRRDQHELDRRRAIEHLGASHYEAACARGAGAPERARRRRRRHSNSLTRRAPRHAAYGAGESVVLRGGCTELDPFPREVGRLLRPHPMKVRETATPHATVPRLTDLAAEGAVNLDPERSEQR
jgi:hypothetical protein